MAYLYGALSVILWATMPVAAKLSLDEIDNFQLLFLSNLFSALMLGSLNALRGKKRSFGHYPRGDYPMLVLLGALGCYLYYLFLYAAFARISAQEAYIVNYTWPIMTVVFALVVLGERIDFRKAFCLGISFFGVWVTITRGRIGSLSFSDYWGILLAFLAACSFGLFSALGKKYKYDASSSVFLYYLFASAMSAITVIFTSNFGLPSARTSLVLAWNGAMGNGISYIFWFKALESGDTAKVAHLAFLTPCVSLFYIAVLLNEKIMPSSILGLAFILMGMGLGSLRLRGGSPQKVGLKSEEKGKLKHQGGIVL